MKFVTPEPRHRKVAQAIRQRIAAGSIAVGEPIPSEAELCAEFGVSRGPVRQALATLRAEGAIAGGRGKPPVVRDRPLAQPFESLLSFSAWAEREGRTPGQRTLEIARRPAGAEAADALSVAEGEPVVELLRLRLLDGGPAMVERTVFVEPVGRMLFDFDTDSGSIYGYLITRGVDLSVGRHTFDAVVADATDRRLLGVGRGAPLLRERRRSADADGTPIEWSDDRYRPDLVVFTIDNARSTYPSVARRDAA